MGFLFPTSPQTRLVRPGLEKGISTWMTNLRY
jgi:hypothetical protein